MLNEQKCTSGQNSRAQPGDQLFEIIDPAEALHGYRGSAPDSQNKETTGGRSASTSMDKRIQDNIYSR